MTWLPALAETQRLLIERVGFRRGEVRLFLRPEETGSPVHVIQLSEVASFYDSLHRGVEVRISDWPKHGSFGWWLAANDPHHSIQVSGVGEGMGFFMALAKRVEYRFGNGADLNWPG